MSSNTEQIKERLSINDVVSSYIKLEKAGKNFKAVCPFHNEKTPSFFISPERNTYYCFGCGAKGDIFSFVQEFEGLDFMGALKILADRAGIVIEDFDPKQKGDRDRLFAALEAATIFFEERMRSNKNALQYIKRRGVTEKTISHFRLGLAPDDWHLLHTALKERGFSDGELERAGLVKKNDKGGYYDVFRNRIIFPVADTSGRVVAFSGRALGEGDAPKYINSAETPLFHKSDILYGFDKAKISMRKYDFCILVEGPMDLIMSHQAGYTNTVAVQGTALTNGQVSKIVRLTHRMVVALDADSAGIASAGRSAQIALRHAMDVKVAALPKGSDPADVVLKGVDGWKKVIHRATHIVEFLLAAVLEEIVDKRKRKLEVRARVLPYVSLIDNKIDQGHFVSTIAERLGVSELAVQEELSKVAFSEKDQFEEAPNINQEILIRRDVLERRLLGLILWQETLPTPKIDIADTTAELRRVSGKDVRKVTLSDEERQDMIFEAEVAFADSSALDKGLKEMLVYLEEEYLKERFALLMEKLKKAEQKEDSDGALTILKQCKDVSKQISDVRNTIVSVY